MKIRRWLWYIGGALVLVLGLVFAVVWGAFQLWHQMFPSAQKIRACQITELHQVYLCPGSKEYVSLNRISKYLIQSVVLSEDASFWQHSGFDFGEIQKSLEKNLQKGRYIRGASTITQQLAKNMYLSADKSLGRKLREALITLQLERTLNKKEILERYLNLIELGHGIYGIQSAALKYFNKSPLELSPVESAYLAHLLPNPKLYSRTHQRRALTPFSYSQVLRILSLLKVTRSISEEQYLQAKKDVLVIWPGTLIPAEGDIDSDTAPETELEPASEPEADTSKSE